MHSQAPEINTAFSYPDLRADLAAALRWAARLGFNEGVDNHFSIAVSNESTDTNQDQFLINPYGWHWSCLLYTSPSPRDQRGSRMPSSA